MSVRQFARPLLCLLSLKSAPSKYHLMLAFFKRSLLGLGLLVLLTSCEKDDPSFSLPPKTTEGLNTLGFLADDKVWVNHGEICNLFTCEDNVVTGQLHRYADKSLGVVIQAYYTDKERNINQQFQVHAKNVTGVGNYVLDSEKEESMSYITDWTKQIFYASAKTSQATLIITKLDTVNHIISGEFSGLLYQHENPSGTVHIRDGRFDTKLTYTKD
jgi:hypothetical protein